MKANHQSRDCLSTNRCLRCGQTHHTLLHEDRQPDPSTDSATSTLKGCTQSSAPPNADSRYLEPSTTPVPVATFTSDVHTSVNHVSVQPQRKVLLQVLPVQIHSQRGLVNTYAVLDPGSDSTRIRKDKADSLQLRGEPHQLNLCAVGWDPTTQNMCRVSFWLSSNNHPEPVPVNGAWVINKLNIPSVKLSKNDAAERWCHLSDVHIPELEGCDVTLLIGSDMAHLLIHLEVRQGRWDEPIAIKTPLGWTLFGIVDNGHCHRINAKFLATDGRTCLQHQIERFWEIDSYATKQSFSEPAMSTDDKQALKILQTGTVKEESHYKTPLLWDGEPNQPTNNRAMAVSRLHPTEKKLKKNPELAKKYQDVISVYVAKVHARKMSSKT